MCIILENFWTSVLVLLVTVFWAIYLRFVYSFRYWKRKSVPFLPPSFPFGNMGKVILWRQNIGEKLKEIYDTMKPKGHKFVGLYFFSRKAFFALDPLLVKNILTKDFQYFDDRGIYYDEVNDPLSAHLFSLSGPKWKNLRHKLTPTFTSGKIKYMFHTFVDCGNDMVAVLNKNAETGDEVEIKDIMGRFTTDVIGSSAFGLDCNSMKHPSTEFREMGKRAFTQTVGDAIRVVIIRSFPQIAKLLRLGIFSSSVTRFFQKVVKETVEYREKHNVCRSDFLQLLIQLKNNGKVDNEERSPETSSQLGTALTLDEATAQAFIFFLAGFETTSTTMSFAMFEMSVNPSIQERARQEVMEVLRKFDNQLSYEAIADMNYLDMVVQETLRKYPPAASYMRKCTKDYLIPETDIILEKGIPVLVSALSLQRDAEYFPEPELFDPERFNEENKQRIQDYTYIPFGDGPRNCIGQRFAMIQIKVGLSLMLKHFKFTLNSRTILPLKMETKGIITTPIGGLWLNLEKTNVMPLNT